jgi:hypothetical protein
MLSVLLPGIMSKQPIACQKRRLSLDLTRPGWQAENSTRTETTITFANEIE